MPQVLAWIAEKAGKVIMLSSRWRWGTGLALGVLVFLAAVGWPAPAASRYGNDARQFAGELQSRGAFKFAEDTENQLRSGKFELAFARYLFLRSHIRGSSLYMALNDMVDQRLHFLAAQMGLKEIPAYAAPSYKKLKRRVIKEAKAVTPAEQKKGKEPEVAPKPGEEEPAEMVIPGAPAAPTPTQPPEEEEKAEEEKPEAKKPPPPPSLWEKLKRRLKFW